jgi:hypothetical protein
MFDYSMFVDNQMSTNDPKLWIKSIQLVIRTVRNWDTAKLGKTVFDKSVAQGDHLKFIKFSIFVNNETPMRQILAGIAVNALENEALNLSPIADKTALSIAEFISELFKIEWISNTAIHRCIGSLATDQFRSMRHVKILHTLIKPIAKNIRKIPFDDSLLFYSKKIQAKTLNITDYESHSLCMEVAQILEIIATQNEEPSMIFKPPTTVDKIKSILNSFTNHSNCASQIKSLNISESDDLNFLVDMIILKAIASSDQTEGLAKLVMELSDVLVIAPNGSVNMFKVHLLSKCQNKYLASFACSTIDASIVQPIFALTRFIAHLYNFDVINEDFLVPCLEILTKNEQSCSNTVFCINIMFQTVGKKIDGKNKTLLNRYFNKFEMIVNNESSQRSFIYGKLIELRNNNWMEKTLKSELKINFKDFGDEEKMEAMVESLKERLKTSESVEKFISAVLKNFLTNHSAISSCAAFFKNFEQIALESDMTFNEILNRSVSSEFEKLTQKTILNQEERSDFTNLLTFVCELYREGVFTDEDLHTWLLMRQVSQIPLDELAYLSLIISPKIQSQGSRHLKTVLGMMENIIHDVTIDVCAGIKNDLMDLTNVVQNCIEKEVNYEQKGKQHQMKD